MAKITRSSLKLETNKDRVTINCKSFLRELVGRGDLLEIGPFTVQIQLNLKGLDPVSTVVQEIVGQEAAVALNSSAGVITKYIDKLKAGIKAKQDEEKTKGNTNASSEAAEMVRSVADQISDVINDLGGDVRKQVESVLKKKKHKVKIMTVNRVGWRNMKLNSKAFRAKPAITYDKKTWSNLIKNIDDHAFPTGHKTVEQYIAHSHEVAEKIKTVVKANEGGDQQTENKDKAQHDLRSALVAFSQTVGSFQKEINQAKELTRATVELKKQKKDLDKRGANLMKTLNQLDQWRNRMSAELETYDKLTDKALNMLKDGKTARMKELVQFFMSTAKQMNVYSTKTKPIAKEIAKQAKLTVQRS